MKNLGELVNIKTGKLDANAANEGGIYPFFTCAVNPLMINTYAYDCECVLVAGNGDLNVKYYKGRFNAYQRTYIIESKDKTVLGVPYLHQFLDNSLEKLRAGTKGGVIQYIRLGDLQNLKIEPPSIQDQIYITSILSKAKSLIRQRKESLRLLDELLKSTFLEMFGDPVRNEKKWEIKSLIDFGSLKNGLNYTRDEEGINIHCLGVGDFKNLHRITDISSLSTLNLTTKPQDAYLLQNGDIVFVRSNGNRELVGRCVVVYPGDREVTFSGFCIRYRPQKEFINSVYLSFLFREHNYRRHMLQHGKGANIQNINQKTLELLKIPMPPAKLQTQFARNVEKTESLKLKYKHSLSELENLYGSLRQRAFGGKSQE